MIYLPLITEQHRSEDTGWRRGENAEAFLFQMISRNVQVRALDDLPYGGHHTSVLCRQHYPGQLDASHFSCFHAGTITMPKYVEVGVQTTEQGHKSANI